MKAALPISNGHSCRSAAVDEDGQTLVMERPWWRRLDGLPPSIERRRATPLSPWAVRLNRGALVAAALIVIVGATTGSLMLAEVVGTTTVLSWVVLPSHHRRQIRGRA